MYLKILCVRVNVQYLIFMLVDLRDLSKNNMQENTQKSEIVAVQKIQEEQDRYSLKRKIVYVNTYLLVVYKRLMKIKLKHDPPVIFPGPLVLIVKYFSVANNIVSPGWITYLLAFIDTFPGARSLRNNSGYTQASWNFCGEFSDEVNVLIPP